MTPEELEESGWTSRMHAVIAAPSEATCGERVIDFFALSPDMGSRVLDVEVLAQAPVSPHAPVKLTLMMVRGKPSQCTRKKWRQFPTEAPVGCLKEHKANQAAPVLAICRSGTLKHETNG